MARTLLLFLFAIVSPFPALNFAALDGGCLPQLCGNVTVSYPFGIVSGFKENGCVQLGFQVHCNGNTPSHGYDEPEYGLQILDIFYANASLIVSDVHKLADFLNRSSHCHVPTANTAWKVAAPFSISPLNQNLVFYNCTRVPAEREGLVETACRNNTFVRAGGWYAESGGIDGGYALPGCTAVAVPVLAADGSVDAGEYGELIGDGFLLTWQPPPGK